MSLRNDQNVEIFKNDDLKKIVKNFYEKLYEALETPKEEILKYLEGVKMGRLQEYHDKILNEEISIVEIREAILNMNKGKAPGPDGLPN